MEEKELGIVTHYFGHLSVGILKLKDSLKVGDTIHFKGHTSDFEQVVESIQIEHKDVQEAKAGDMVGLKVKEHVREHDAVYKVVK
jgi:translation elongation factor EF-1alpha